MHSTCNIDIEDYETKSIGRLDMQFPGEGPLLDTDACESDGPMTESMRLVMVRSGVVSINDSGPIPLKVNVFLLLKIE